MRSWNSCSGAMATRPISWRATIPATMHQLMASTLDTVFEEIERIQAEARSGVRERPRWPMIILRSPKGWTCPKEIDGKKTEDYWRSHQVPMGEMHGNPEHVRILESWLKSYRPDELFDDEGRLRKELAALAPAGERRMSANPHGNGGLLLRDLQMPDFRDYAIEVTSPGSVIAESTRVDGPHAARRHEAQHGLAQFPPVQPGREQFQPLAGRAGGHQPHLDGGNPAVGRPSRAPTGG